MRGKMFFAALMALGIGAVMIVKNKNQSTQENETTKNSENRKYEEEEEKEGHQSGADKQLQTWFWQKGYPNQPFQPILMQCNSIQDLSFIHSLLRAKNITRIKPINQHKIRHPSPLLETQIILRADTAGSTRSIRSAIHRIVRHVHTEHGFI